MRFLWKTSQRYYIHPFNATQKVRNESSAAWPINDINTWCIMYIYARNILTILARQFLSYALWNNCMKNRITHLVPSVHAFLFREAPEKIQKNIGWREWERQVRKREGEIEREESEEKGNFSGGIKYGNGHVIYLRERQRNYAKYGRSSKLYGSSGGTSRFMNYNAVSPLRDAAVLDFHAHTRRTTEFVMVVKRLCLSSPMAYPDFY